MKRGRKNDKQPLKTARKNGSNKNTTLPKLGVNKKTIDDSSTGDHVLNACVDDGPPESLPKVESINKRRNSSPEQKPYIYNNTKPVQLRLRTPSPERRKRNLKGMDKLDINSQSTLVKVMEDLNVLRNTRAKMEERAILKYQNRFTELPTPIWNPPPKGMPRNNEIIQRVLDRRDVGQSGVLYQESRRLPFDMHLLKMGYDTPPEVYTHTQKYYNK